MVNLNGKLGSMFGGQRMRSNGEPETEPEV
jgi:hypothetical protein